MFHAITTTSSFFSTNVFCSPFAAVGHQVYGPEADAAALHRRRHPGEIPGGPDLLLGAALPGQGGAG